MAEALMRLRDATKPVSTFSVVVATGEAAGIDAALPALGLALVFTRAAAYPPEVRVETAGGNEFSAVHALQNLFSHRHFAPPRDVSRTHPNLIDTSVFT